MKSSNLFRLIGAALMGALVLALAPALSAQSASTYVTSGLDKYRQGNLEGAIADYTKALEYNSSYLSAYHNRGMARSRQGNFDGAVADYTMAIKLKPALADAYYYRGSGEFMQGNFDAAIADFSKAIELKPDYRSAFFRRGLARESQTNFHAASEDYTKALEFKGDSDDAVSYMLLYSALLGRRMGHGNDARLKAATGWANEWTRALALFLTDQMAEADLLKLASAAGGAEKPQQESEARYFVGVFKVIAGDKAAAKADFQLAFDGSGPAALLHRLSLTELNRL